MPWLMFLGSLISFVLLCYTHSVPFGFLCVLLTLGFLVGGLLKLVAARVGNDSRDTGRIVTPEELRMYREQAEARKQAAAAEKAPKPAPPPDSSNLDSSSPDSSGPPPSTSA